MTARVILLHGPSSAGKSTLARAVQDALDEPFLRFSLDMFLFGGAVLPARRDEAGAFAWHALRPKLFDGYYGCLGAMLRAGNDLVVDCIIEDAWQRRRLHDELRAADVFFVGLDCPLEELERRERARGDRRGGDARRDVALFGKAGPYDLVIDATEPPQQGAARLVAAWHQRNGRRAFGAEP